MEKVTQKLEAGSVEVLARLQKAVRSIHGKRDPDLEQEAYVRTLEAFRKTTRVSHPDALMWKVVRNTVADHWRLRRRNRTDTVAELADDMVAERPVPEESLDRKRRVEALHAAILRLGCDIRGPVYLYYVEGYAIATIARLYEKSPSAIKMALHRGRRRLERMCRQKPV